MEITEKQQLRINELTEKYGIDEKQSEIEKDTDGSFFYYFKASYGNGYACIQENGAIEAGNLGYYDAL